MKIKSIKYRYWEKNKGNEFLRKRKYFWQQTCYMDSATRTITILMMNKEKNKKTFIILPNSDENLPTLNWTGNSKVKFSKYKQ